MNEVVVFIPFTNSAGTTVVDFDDFPKVRDQKWRKDNGYASRSVTRIGRVYMHRVIMGVEGDVQIDHRDHDTLNNRRSNLRLATVSQNGGNQLKTSKTTYSKWKGVSKSCGDGTWRAYIQCDGKPIRLGVYATEIEAARAYNDAATRLFGQFALLNDVSAGEFHRIPKGNKRMHNGHPVSSRFRGVTWNKRLRKWIAQSRNGKQTKHIGVFINEEDAGIAVKAFESNQSP